MAEVVSGGAPERGRAPRWLPPVAVVAVAAVAALVAWPSGGPQRAALPSPQGTRLGGAVAPALAARTPTPSPGSTCCRPVADRGVALGPAAAATAAAALSLTGTGTSVGGALERVDAGAASGPWSVIVRAADGAFARRSAVVTFPVAAPDPGEPVAVGEVEGEVVGRDVVWPLAARYARVRGDLPRADLVRIAAATTVAGGRPAVGALRGLRVVATAPSRSSRLPELRYDGGQLGVFPVAGLVYTGIFRGAGFEDQVLAGPLQRCASRRGPTVVVSGVLGGNGSLSWELAPGVVAYVGYSGSDLVGAVVDRLYELVGRTAPLAATQWRALRPLAVPARNDAR